MGWQMVVGLFALVAYLRCHTTRPRSHTREEVSEPRRIKVSRSTTQPSSFVLGPTAEQPWRGRQGEHLRGDSSKPNGAEPWEEVYNRRVTDDLLFSIEYADSDGVVTEREIRPISIHLVRNEAFVYIKAHCSARQDTRTFHSDRIQSTKNLKTGRMIGDLGQYLRGKY